MLHALREAITNVEALMLVLIAVGYDLRDMR